MATRGGRCLSFMDWSTNSSSDIRLPNEGFNKSHNSGIPI